MTVKVEVNKLSIYCHYRTVRHKFSIFHAKWGAPASCGKSIATPPTFEVKLFSSLWVSYGFSTFYQKQGLSLFSLHVAAFGEKLLPSSYSSTWVLAFYAKRGSSHTFPTLSGRNYFHRFTCVFDFSRISFFLLTKWQKRSMILIF